MFQISPQRELVLKFPDLVDSPLSLLLGLQAAAINVAELFRCDLPGRFEAASLLGRTEPGREQRQAGRWNLCFFAGLSCSAGYPEAPVTRWMIRANCSAGAWSSCSSSGWCLVKAAWGCSFLLVWGTVLSWTSALLSSLPA